MRTHRRRSRGHSTHGGNHMVLVPFIDMLIILVVFMLMHTSDVEVLPNLRNIAIPSSWSQAPPRPSVVVMVTKDDLLVDGKVVARLADLLDSEQTLIEPLQDVLESQAESVLSRPGDAAPEREVTIMADRDTPYRLLRKVMATCTQAKYSKVSLAVIEREGALAGSRTAELGAMP